MLKTLAKTCALRFGYDIRRASTGRFCDPRSLGKAKMFTERFREVVSDPLNLLIHRVPEAGFVDENNHVILHNGNRVPIRGPHAYYWDFSDVLIINRGVHEPLEEYCFQAVLSKLSVEAPRMIELGAYWAHYSMWLLQVRPQATCYMVEPDPVNLNSGKHNFAVNGYRGEFIQALVGSTGLQLDEFVAERGIAALDILHSDIQGSELEMLEGARKFLSEHRADYIFISTHSEAKHEAVIKQLRDYSYRVEVSSGFDKHTTSFDGFVLATSPALQPLFNSFAPLGRVEIARSTPERLLQSLTSIQL